MCATDPRFVRRSRRAKGAGVGLSMSERKSVTKQMRQSYLKATKSEKGRIIDQLCLVNGWSRGHARQELAGSRPSVEPRPRVRSKIYGPEIMPALIKVWAALGGICGKRLAPFMDEA